MKQACRNSGGTPAAETYNEWVAGGGCRCGGSASGSPTCSGGATGAPSGVAVQVAGQIGFALGEALRKQAEENEAAQRAAQETEAARQRDALARWMAERELKREGSKAFLLASLREPVVRSLKASGQRDPERPAGGGSIVDCDHLRAVYERMGAGLGVQFDALERSRREMEDLRKERKKLQGEVVAKLFDTAYEVGHEMVTDFSAIRSRVAAMNAAGMSAEQRRDWLESMDALHRLREMIDAHNKRADALDNLAKDPPKLADGMRALGLKIDTFLADSGALKQGGLTLAKYGLGPQWAAAFRALALGVDWTSLIGEGYLNDEDWERARAAYEAYSDAIRSTEGKIEEARLELADPEYCPNRGGAASAPGDGASGSPTSQVFQPK